MQDSKKKKKKKPQMNKGLREQDSDWFWIARKFGSFLYIDSWDLGEVGFEFWTKISCKDLEVPTNWTTIL